MMEGFERKLVGIGDLEREALGGVDLSRIFWDSCFKSIYIFEMSSKGLLIIGFFRSLFYVTDC
jgi:hypothetical protein